MMTTECPYCPPMVMRCIHFDGLYLIAHKATAFNDTIAICAGSGLPEFEEEEHSFVKWAHIAAIDTRVCPQEDFDALWQSEEERFLFEGVRS